MGIQYWWWLGAIALGTAEMFTGSFYLLVLAAGAAGAGLAAALGSGAAGQFAAAAAISLGGAALVRRLRPKGDGDLPSERNPDVNLDIGQTLEVGQWQEGRRSRVAYRGAMWDVELMPGEPAVPGRFVIREVEGSRLRLACAAPTFPDSRASGSGLAPGQDRPPGSAARSAPGSPSNSAPRPDSGVAPGTVPGPASGGALDPRSIPPDRTIE